MSRTAPPHTGSSPAKRLSRAIQDGSFWTIPGLRTIQHDVPYWTLSGLVQTYRRNGRDWSTSDGHQTLSPASVRRQIDWPETLRRRQLTTIVWDPSRHEWAGIPEAWTCRPHPTTPPSAEIMAPDTSQYHLVVEHDQVHVTQTHRGTPPADPVNLATSVLGGTFRCYLCGRWHQHTYETYRRCAEIIVRTLCGDDVICGFGSPILRWDAGSQLGCYESRFVYAQTQRAWSLHQISEIKDIFTTLRGLTITQELPAVSPSHLAVPDPLSAYQAQAHDLLETWRHDVAIRQDTKRRLCAFLETTFPLPHPAGPPQEQPQAPCGGETVTQPDSELSGEDRGFAPPTLAELHRVAQLLGPGTESKRVPSTTCGPRGRIRLTQHFSSDPAVFLLPTTSQPRQDELYQWVERVCQCARPLPRKPPSSLSVVVWQPGQLGLDETFWAGVIADLEQGIIEFDTQPLRPLEDELGRTASV